MGRRSKETIRVSVHSAGRESVYRLLLKLLLKQVRYFDADGRRR